MQPEIDHVHDDECDEWVTLRVSTRAALALAIVSLATVAAAAIGVYALAMGR